MLTRRDAVSSTVLAGLGAGLAATSSPAATPAGAGAGAAGDTAQSAQDALRDRELLQTLREIRDELRGWRRDDSSCRMPMCGGLGLIRRNQRQFLKSNQKFPDYMEVGANVWDELVDWHVRTIRQVQITQRPDGRYTMPFLQTTMVLRVDYDDDQVGLGYDTRAGG
jgi:hypothetical protein